MRENASPTTSTRTATETRTGVETSQLEQLIRNAEAAAVRRERDDVQVERWGRDSFPASDPPQNY